MNHVIASFVLKWGQTIKVTPAFAERIANLRAVLDFRQFMCLYQSSYFWHCLTDHRSARPDCLLWGEVCWLSHCVAFHLKLEWQKNKYGKVLNQPWDWQCVLQMWASLESSAVVPFDRPPACMEEGDGTKMQQLHGKVRTPLPKSYRNGDAVVGSWQTVACPAVVAPILLVGGWRLVLDQYFLSVIPFTKGTDSSRNPMETELQFLGKIMV